MREWWWEFTRRRPDYRALWDGASDLPGHAYRFAADVDEFRLRFELSVIHNPASRFTDQELFELRYPRNFARSPREPLFEQADNPHIGMAFGIAAHRNRLAEDEGQRLFNFDLSHPLGPQLEQAERYLKAVQSELFGKISTRRPRLDNWRDFLRSIDARDAGATYREMRDVFWPERAKRRDGKEDKTEQSARDTHAAACELRVNFPI